MILYGIPNCDSVKKARKWLDENGIEYLFHDFKKDGVPEDSLRDWIGAVGWEALLNKRGTTFRKLDDAVKADIDAGIAASLMLTHPTLIKRPVAETGDGKPLIGFDKSEWERRVRG